MKNLKFYTLLERKPDNEQKIWCIRASEFYGTYEFEYGKVEYSYEELDDESNFTGSSYFERPPQEGEEDYDPTFKYVLYYMFKGEGLRNNDLWAPAEELETVLFDEGK